MFIKKKKVIYRYCILFKLTNVDVGIGCKNTVLILAIVSIHKQKRVMARSSGVFTQIHQRKEQKNINESFSVCLLFSHILPDISPVIKQPMETTIIGEIRLLRTM